MITLANAAVYMGLPNTDWAELTKLVKKVATFSCCGKSVFATPRD
jgi:hypothetical protein